MIFNDHLRTHKMNKLGSLTIKGKTSKKSILHHIRAISHTRGTDARTFVGSIKSLVVTQTVCYNLEFLRFSLPKMGGRRSFWSKLVKFLSFDHFCVLKFFFRFQKFFSFSKVISCCLMAFVADFNWRQHVTSHTWQRL